MFNELNGLPVHPLAVHAAVVMIPLAALLGVLFAVPRMRDWSRLPLLLVSIAAVVATFVAKGSGEKFEEVIKPAGDTGALVEQHQERANLLFILVIVFAVVSIAAFVLTRKRHVSRTLTTGLAVLLVVGAGALVVQTYRVGDIGSRAVWNPSGTQDYSGS